MADAGSSRRRNRRIDEDPVAGVTPANGEAPQVAPAPPATEPTSGSSHIRVVGCLSITVVVIALLWASCYPHIGGRPSWYSSVWSCTENMTISESYDPNLELTIAQSVKEFMETLSQEHPFETIKRGQHARSIACLKANFQVLPDIPTEYRKGVFSTPQTFKSWVRFSPGQSDIKTDLESHARGMAIKLSGVPGEKLMQDEKTTQDFILLNSPVFFTGDNHDYVSLIPNMNNPVAVWDFSWARTRLLAMMIYVAKMLSFSDNPLTHLFYSTTPYRLGNDMVVKYTVRPCGPISVEYAQGPSQMRAALKATLDPISGQDVCYNFYVQKRVDACTEPVEDPTIPWNTELVHVAKLTIPKQNFMHEDQFGFCETLAFNPWHSLPEHRPLGAINHVRRLVYEESLKLREASGKYVAAEPIGTEKFEKSLQDINFDLTTLVPPAGNTKHYRFQPYAKNASDVDVIHIPSHVKGVPPGEDFQVETFLALLMRMFIGDTTNEMVDTLGATEDDDESFLEVEWDSLLAGAGSFVAEKLSNHALFNRWKEARGVANPKVTEVDATLTEVKAKMMSWIIKMFKRPSKEPQNQDFGSAIDMITTIFKRMSRAKMDQFQDPQEYEKLFARSFATDMPWFVEDGKWRRDDVFAGQFIRGVNPTQIRRMTKDRRPSQLKLDEARISIINEHIRRLRPGFNGADVAHPETMESVMEKGELFYAEYSVLHGLARAWDAYLSEPVILFTLTTAEKAIDRNLMPVAIQMEDGRTFYPPTSVDCNNRKHFNDNECLVWLFAKMHVMSADGNVHESYTHLGMTHLMLEPIIVAARRHMALTHPIYRTLEPHFHQTIAINNEGRDTLINPKGIFERTTGLGIKGSLQLINRGFNELNFIEWTFPKRMEAAGFPFIPAQDRLRHGTDTLPGYLYRDFCYDLWYSIHRYMVAVVDTVYPEETDMQNDHQLAGFALEVSSPQFGNIPTFPSSFTSKAQLADAMSIIAFTASVQHSAVNFGQFDAYGFVPNRPLTLTQPMPADLSKISMKYILSALPNKDRAFGQMAITFALSIPPQKTGDVIPLEWASTHSDSLSPAPGAFKTLIREYTDLTRTMRATTLLGNWQYYTYVYPDLLAVSIAI